MLCYGYLNVVSLRNLIPEARSGENKAVHKLLNIWRKRFYYNPAIFFTNPCYLLFNYFSSMIGDSRVRDLYCGTLTVPYSKCSGEWFNNFPATNACLWLNLIKSKPWKFNRSYLIISEGYWHKQEVCYIIPWNLYVQKVLCSTVLFFKFKMQCL